MNNINNNKLFIVTIGPSSDEAVCGNCGGGVNERGLCQEYDYHHVGSVPAADFGPNARKNGKYACTGTIEDMISLAAYLRDCNHEVSWEEASAGLMTVGDLSDFLEPRDV